MKTPLLAIGSASNKDWRMQTRINQPFRELAKQYDYAGRIISNVEDENWQSPPGILYTTEASPEGGAAWQILSKQADLGWLWVHDVRDVPSDLTSAREPAIRAILSAHLVSCSTQGLAEICRQWNPNVHVVADQIGVYPPESMIARTVDTPRLLIQDHKDAAEWQGGWPFVVDSLEEFADQIEVFNLGSASGAQQFPESVAVRNLGAMGYGEYLKLLDHLDIALIAADDRESNRSKSDMAIIEALAHGLLPIVSSSAAKQSQVPDEYMLIVNEPEDWARHLIGLLDEPNAIGDQRLAGYKYVVRDRLWSEHVYELDRIYRNAIQNLTSLQLERQDRIAAYRAGDQSALREND